MLYKIVSIFMVTTFLSIIIKYLIHVNKMIKNINKMNCDKELNQNKRISIKKFF